MDLTARVNAVRAGLLNNTMNSEQADEVLSGLTLEVIRHVRQVSPEEASAQLTRLLFAKVDLSAPIEHLDTRAKLASLKSQKRCGKLMTEGDLVYNCKQCQADPTCILCQECFSKSDHTGHEVIFHKAAPGGCCDCGDEEAWDPKGFCSDHGKNGAAASKELPTEVGSQARVMFKAMFEVMAQTVAEILLSYERAIWRSPADGEEEEEGSAEEENDLAAMLNCQGPWYLLLNNDDVHEFRRVIQVLVSEPLKMPQNHADMVTRSVDKDGRAPIWKSAPFASKPEANRELALARAKLQMAEAEGLLVCISYATQVHREKEAVNCMKWMTSLAEVSDGFVEVLAECFLADMQLPFMARARKGGKRYMRTRDSTWGNDQQDPGYISEAQKRCLLYDVLRFDFLLPKVFATSLNDLCMRALVDEQFKITFGRVFAQCYEDVCQAYRIGLGTNKETCLGFGVQVLTAPSVVHSLNRTLPFLQTALVALRDFMVPKPAMEVETRTESKVLETSVVPATEAAFRLHRYQPLVHNAYMPFRLNLCTIVAEKERETFFLLIESLASFQYTDKLRRHLGREHVTRESEAFYVSFQLSLTFSTLIRLSAVQLAQDVTGKPQLLQDLLRDIDARVLLPNSAVYVESPVATRYLGTHDCRSVNVYGGDPFSFHLPIQRFIGQAFRQLMRRVKSSHEDYLPEEGMLLRLVQDTVTTLAANAQIISALWRKNGTTVQQQSIFYQDQFAHSFYTPDVYLLQLAASALPHDKLLTIFLRLFQLVEFVDRGQVVSGLEDTAPVLLEEVLRVVLTVSTCVLYEDKDIVRLQKHVIHRLALADSAFSAITESLSRAEFGEELDQDSAVVEALMKCATQHGNAYRLNEDLWDEVDPYHFSLSRTEQEVVAGNKLAHFKKLGKKSWPLSKASSDSALPPYQKCQQLLTSSSFVFLLRNILVDVVGSLRNLAGAQGRGIVLMDQETPRVVKWEDVDNHAKRVTSSLANVVLSALTMALRTFENDTSAIEELVLARTGNDDPTQLENASIAELLVAWAKDVHVEEEEFSANIRWCLSFIRSKSKKLKTLTSAILDTMGLKGKKKNKGKKKGNAKEQKLRGQAAQKAAMERMKQKMLQFHLDEDMEGDEDLEKEKHVEGEEKNTCALCREHATLENPMAGVGFVQPSSWGVPLPLLPSEIPVEVLKCQRLPAGWTKPVERSQRSRQLQAFSRAVHRRLEGELGGDDRMDEQTEGLDWAIAQLVMTAEDSDYEDGLNLLEEQEDEAVGGGGIAGVATDTGTGARSHGTERMSTQTVPNSAMEDHVSFCGHKMHVGCLQNYLQTSREGNRTNGSHDTRKAEFLCPICKSISNVYVPEFPQRDEHSYLRQEEAVDASTNCKEVKDFLWPSESGEGGYFSSRGPSIWESLQFSLHKAKASLPQEGSMRQHVKRMLTRYMRNSQSKYFDLKSPGSVARALLTLTKSVAASLSAIEAKHHDYCHDVSEGRESWHETADQMVKQLDKDREMWKSVLFCLRTIGLQLLDEESPKSRASSEVKAGMARRSKSPRPRSRSFLQNVVPSILNQLGFSTAKGNETGNDSAVLAQASNGGRPQKRLSLQVLRDYDTFARVPLLAMLVSGSTAGLDESFDVSTEQYLGETFCTPKLFGDFPKAESEDSTEKRCSIPSFVEASRQQKVSLALNERSGVGISVAMSGMDSSVFVSGILRGGDVDNGKEMKLGDYILKVNGESVQGKLLKDVATMIRGGDEEKGGDMVELEIYRYAEVGALLDCEDMFPVLVSFHSFIAPGMSQLQEVMMIVRILAIASVVQALVSRMRTTARISSRGCRHASAVPEAFKKALGDLWLVVNAKAYDKEVGITDDDERFILLDKVLMFLRKASLFCSLLAENGEFQVAKGEGPDELERLWKGFGIPSLGEVVQDAALMKILNGWVLEWRRLNPNAKPRIAQALTKNGPGDCCLLRSSATLVQLPKNYQDLYFAVRQRARCPTKGDTIVEPVLCLRCGCVLCGSRKCCRRNRVGPITAHAAACCGSTGVFLHLSHCQVLLVRGNYAVFTDAPYVDQYGEHDPGLRKGRILTLNEGEYSVLREMCTSHRIAQFVTNIRNNQDRRIRLATY